MTVIKNDEILATIDTAMKGITDVTALGESVLSPEKFDRFIRTMQNKTVILPEARFIEMNSQQTDIDRVAFIGRILKSGTAANGDHKVLAENEYAKPQTETNKLIAKELQAIVSLRDNALRRNIERGNFENTLVELMGEAAGRDFEEWGTLADTDIAAADDLMLSLTDGWVKNAVNKVYGVESASAAADQDFTPTANTWPENMFKAMLDALPKQYIQTRSEWRFYVPYEVEDGYRDLLKARGTALGDLAQTSGDSLMYKGIPVVYAPIIERSQPIADGGAGKVALLSHPDNMAWGVFQDVVIEPEREAKKRQTDFVLTFEGDANYEDENAAVAAYIEAPKPA